MKSHHTTVWILWTAVASLISVTSQNPIYLALMLAPLTLIANSFKIKVFDCIRLGIIFSIPLFLINILFVHTGSHEILRMPQKINLYGHTIPLLLVSGPITLEAVTSALIFALLFIDMLMIFSILNVAVNPDSLLNIMPKRLSQSTLLTSITLRFIPTLAKDLESVSDAQKSRGLDPDRGNILQRMRNHISVIVPTLVCSLERSYNLAEAMESRAYTGIRTKHSNEKWDNHDTFFTAFLILLGLEFVYLKLSGHLDYWNPLDWRMNPVPIQPAVALSILMLSIIYQKNECNR